MAGDGDAGVSGMPGDVDELEEYLATLLEYDPEFRAAYEAAGRWQRRAYPGKLAVDGHAYQRRLRSRRKRGRR